MALDSLDFDSFRSLVEQIVQDSRFRSAAFGYAGKAAWDATKFVAGRIRQALASPTDEESAKAFESLLADSRFVREVQLLVNTALRTAGPDVAEKAAADAEIGIATVLKFLTAPQAGRPILTDQLRHSFCEGATQPNGLTAADLDRLIVAFLLSLASSQLAAPIQLAATQQVHESVIAGQAENRRQVSEIKHLLGEIKTEIAQSHPSTGSPSERGTVAPLPLLPSLRALLPETATDERIDVDIRQTFAPPPLPADFVRRDRVRADIKQRLDAAPVLGITGYPESGKTASVADYALNVNSVCFWFPLAQYGIEDLLFGLKLFLGGHPHDPSLPRLLQDRLIKFVESTALLIVIDNVEQLGDVQSLTFLFEAAAASRGRMHVIVIHSDRPDVQTGARLAGIRTWRLLGMEPHEAAALLANRGVTVTQARLSALHAACLAWEGHVGMLRMSLHEISAIRDDSDLTEFFRAIPQGSNALPFLAALTDRFVRSLSEEARRLCVRVSITIGAFGRPLAEALWRCGEEPSAFLPVWTNCAAGVFEAESGGRCRIPQLYKDRLQELANTDDVRVWNRVAADHLAEPRDHTWNPYDLFYSVVHRCRAGDLNDAVASASAFIAVAERGENLDVLHFLLVQLTEVLRLFRAVDQASSASKVSWYVCRVHGFGLLEDQGRAEEAAASLLAVLEVADDSTLSPERRSLGWYGVLTNAARYGNVQLAERAAMQVVALRDALAAAQQPDPFSIVGSVLMAYAKSRENALPYVRSVIAQLAAGTFARSDVWSDDAGYSLWRAVTMQVHQGLSLLASGDPVGIERTDAALWECATDALRTGATEVGLVLGTASVVVAIDFRRQVQVAIERARTLRASLPQVQDRRIRALTLTGIGDALRCGGQFGDALDVYQNARTIWTELDERFELVMAELKSVVTLGRMGRVEEGLGMARKAAKASRAIPSTKRFLVQVECYIEMALIAFRGNRTRTVLAALLAAHRVLRGQVDHGPYWTLIAQFAFLSGRREAVETERTLPEPGYTFGLPDVIPGSECMLPSAPYVALAIACMDAGLHHRSLDLLEFACTASDAAFFHSGIRSIAFGVALRGRDLRSAVRQAIRLMSLSPPPGVEQFFGGHERYLRDTVVYQVIELAVQQSREDQPVRLLDQAIAEAQGAPDSVLTTPYRLLFDSLIALRRATVEGMDDAVHTAYRSAVSAGGFDLGRVLAWFRCFIFPFGRPEHIGSLVLWHRRLVSLTRYCHGTKVDFLASFVSQLQAIWDRWSTATDDHSVRAVAAMLKKEGVAPAVLQQLEAALWAELRTHVGRGRLYDELVDTFRSGHDLQVLAAVREEILGDLLDDVLSPASVAIGLELEAALRRMIEVLSETSHQPEDTREAWRIPLSRIETVQNALRTRVVSDAGVAALLGLTVLRKRLSAFSGANWFLALAQFAGATGFNRSEHARQVEEVLSTTSISQFLDTTPGLPRNVATRLRIVALKTDGEAAVAAASEPNMLSILQSQMQGPIAVRAVVGQESAQRASEERFARVIRDLDGFEAELRERNDDRDGLCTCIFNRAMLRYEWAVSHLPIHATIREEYESLARAAARDFEAALDIAIPLNDDAIVALSAARLATITGDLGDAQAREKYARLAKEHAGRTQDEELTEMVQSTLASETPLAFASRQQREGKREIPKEEQEEFVRLTADRMMKASGWPADRRRNLEDDLHKDLRIQAVQRDFCRHLQPLQDLRHTQSPETIYSRSTTYVCSCTLLGYQTVIENEDIDVVVTSMQKNYCEGCARREPGRPTS